MPATHLICPDGSTISFEECKASCKQCQRCMPKTVILTVINQAKDRGLAKHSVTELLRGTRESYLIKKYNYAVHPHRYLAAIEGTGLHLLNETTVIDSLKKDGYDENENPGWAKVETRFANDIATGQIDAYGYIFNDEELVLCDYKLTSSFKVMKALGIASVDVPTGDFYKTGLKAGTEKTRKVLTSGHPKQCFEWILQQNFYRMLLEENGYPVDGMYIHAYVKDFGAGLSSSRGITKPSYTIKLGKVSNHWIRIWFKEKQRRLDYALETNTLPEKCSAKECWNGRKCRDFCDVAEICQKLEKERSPF